jgi:hypothetical protein
VPISVAFDKLRQRLPELVEGKIGTIQMNIAYRTSEIHH